MVYREPIRVGHKHFQTPDKLPSLGALIVGHEILIKPGCRVPYQMRSNKGKEGVVVVFDILDAGETFFKVCDCGGTTDSELVTHVSKYLIVSY